MLTQSDLVYYIIYIICLFYSFKAKSINIPGLNLLRILICYGFFTEMVVELLQYFKTEENWPYYLYIPIEYVLICNFLKRNTRKKFLKNLITISIYIYLIENYLLTNFFHHFENYPSAIYNTSCFFITIWIVVIFFDLDLSDNLPITSVPIFWILCAFLIFYSGIFFFNGAYNYFLQNASTIAKNLRVYINTVLNCILYLVLTYAFICSQNIKRFY